MWYLVILITLNSVKTITLELILPKLCLGIKAFFFFYLRQIQSLLMKHFSFGRKSKQAAGLALIFRQITLSVINWFSAHDFLSTFSKKLVFSILKMSQAVKFYNSLRPLSLFRHSHFLETICVKDRFSIFQSYSQGEFENNCLFGTLKFSSVTNTRKIKLQDKKNSAHFHIFAILFLAIKEFKQQKPKLTSEMSYE